LIYFFIPHIITFYIAIFFSALWNALWSGTWHAKLQEDLEACWKQHDFWKIIWRLIALSNIGKLLTPAMIYFILKHFNDYWYHILAWLDVTFWSIAIYFVFQFKEVQKSNKIPWVNSRTFIKIQKEILLKWIKFVFSKNKLYTLMLLMIFGNNIGYLSQILLPSLNNTWIEDFISSYIIWWWTLAWILWNLFPDKIAKKIWWEILFVTLIWINSFLHFIAYYFIENQIIFISTFIAVCFVIWMYIPTWNHLLICFSKIKEKATVRSIFFLIIWWIEWIMLYILSFLEIKEVLFILSIITWTGFIVWFKILLRTKNHV
jgi:hypothetical protein